MQAPVLWSRSAASRWVGAVTWYVVRGTWYVTWLRDTWYVTWLRGTWYVVRGTWYVTWYGCTAVSDLAKASLMKL